MDLYKFHASGLIHMKFQYLYKKDILGAGFRSRQPETAHYYGDALWHHQSGFHMSQKDQQLQTYSHQASPTIGYITPDPYPIEQQK